MPCEHRLSSSGWVRRAARTSGCDLDNGSIVVKSLILSSKHSC
jgi:hypothetical protein